MRVRPELLFFITILIIGTSGCTVSDNNGLVGNWVGELTHQGKGFSIRLNLYYSGDSLVANIDLPGYITYGCPCRVTVASDSLIIYPELLPDVELRLTLDGGNLSGICNNFQKVSSDVLLSKKSNSPVKYREESVEFENGDAELKGTLVLPDEGEGPFPVIVWTHASPPQTRETFHYVARAYLLAQQGIGALIYDKRGAGESSGSESWKSENLIGDAQAALNAIKDHPKVDGGKLGIGGFSQGGWVAPAVASTDNSIDFVLVGATPLIPSGRQNLFSMMRRLQLASFAEAEVNDAVALMTSLYEFYQSGEKRASIKSELELAKNKKWFSNKNFQRVMFMPDNGLPMGKHPYWQPFSPDPSEIWHTITVPVLSVWGQEDINLPADSCRALLEKALEKAGNRDFTLKVFPGAGHGLWNEEEVGDWDWTRQVSGYHELLVDWATERFVD